MSKTTNIFHVAGNYIAEQHIDIHDNQHVYLGSAEEAPRPHEGGEKAPRPPKEGEKAEQVLSIPHEGKYTEVRRYIEERKRFDEEFKTFCQERSLRELCKRLTNEFGWFVDENSLQKNLNRNR